MASAGKRIRLRRPRLLGVGPGHAYLMEADESLSADRARTTKLLDASGHNAPSFTGILPASLSRILFSALGASAQAHPGSRISRPCSGRGDKDMPHPQRTLLKNLVRDEPRRPWHHANDRRGIQAASPAGQSRRVGLVFSPPDFRLDSASKENLLPSPVSAPWWKSGYLHRSRWLTEPPYSGLRASPDRRGHAAWILEELHRLKSGLTSPVLLMSYLKPACSSFGRQRASAAGSAAGVRRIIVPDLPFEESADLNGPRSRGPGVVVSGYSGDAPVVGWRWLCRGAKVSCMPSSMTGPRGRPKRPPPTCRPMCWKTWIGQWRCSSVPVAGIRPSAPDIRSLALSATWTAWWSAPHLWKSWSEAKMS